MKIRCRSCNYQETFNCELVMKIIGGSTTIFGTWAWISYLFAGTGFALPICVALVTGGTIVSSFSTEIALWLCSNYACPKCNKHDWAVY